MNHLLELLRDLLFVPKCAGCGERLSAGGGPLCGECRRVYDFEKERTCPFCGSALPACSCSGAFLEKNGVRRLIKLFRYYPGDAEAVTNCMIYRLKHEAPRPLVSFLAHELAEAIRPHLDRSERTLVTFAPRSLSARRRDGFDHMAHLSRAVAGELGVEWRRLLVRHGGSEQKKRITRVERFANMKQAYSYVGKEDLRGTRVILLDDVATSGATLLFASRTLRRAGAGNVVTAVLGTTLLE